MCTDSITFVTP